MKRRHFMAVLGGMLALPVVARGQSASAAAPKLAIVSPSESEAMMSANSDSRYYRALFAELRRLGRIEGQNLVVEPYGREKEAAGFAPVELV